MLALEAGLAAALILIMRDEGLAADVPGDGPGDRPLRRARLRLDRQVVAVEEEAWRSRSPDGAGTWRGRLRRASSSARACIIPPRSAAAHRRIPAILVAFGAVLWTKGFGPEDRELFRMKKEEVEELREAEEAAAGARPDRRRYRLAASAGSGACR